MKVCADTPNQRKLKYKLALSNATKVLHLNILHPIELFVLSSLKKAAYFLQNSPEMNISDIAYRLGFGNPQYFNKCFKELFDIAPTQYRKAHNTSSEPSVK